MKFEKGQRVRVVDEIVGYWPRVGWTGAMWRDEGCGTVSIVWDESVVSKDLGSDRRSCCLLPMLAAADAPAVGAPAVTLAKAEDLVAFEIGASDASGAWVRRRDHDALRGELERMRAHALKPNNNDLVVPGITWPYAQRVCDKCHCAVIGYGTTRPGHGVVSCPGCVWDSKEEAVRSVADLRDKCGQLEHDLKEELGHSRALEVELNRLKARGSR